MTWEDFVNNSPPNFENPGQVLTDIPCPKCGKNIYLNNLIVLSSIPPKYSYWCTCGWAGCAFTKWTPLLKNFDF